MKKSYRKQMFTHIIRIILCVPLTIFSFIIFIVSFTILFKEFFLGLLWLGISSFMTYHLGKTSVTAIVDTITEKNKKVYYSDVYIMQSKQLSFFAGVYANYDLFVATDSNETNYILTPAFHDYFHDKGEGTYTIGIQGGIKFSTHITSTFGKMNLIEVYSIEKKEG